MRLTIDTQVNINFYRLIPLALILWPAGNAIGDRVLAHYFTFEENPSIEQTRVLEGDMIAGYKVTSEYQLNRPHPVYGDQRPHYGVDLATPIGTEVMAPEESVVTCWWDENGGGEVATVTRSDGQVHQLLHLSSCVGGVYDPGETFARTGNSGEGTGAHLDVRRKDKTEPMREDVEPFLTGKPARAYLSDTEITCTIGAAEGTRDSNCQPNEHYDSHTDPGNGARNQGTFSYQHGAASPEDADKKQMIRLRQAEKELQAQAETKWGRGLSKKGLAAALDLWNQAPQAADDFIHHLPSPNPTETEIIKARSKSYVDPATGQLDAPGLRNDPERVEADQRRRTGEVLRQLEEGKSAQKTMTRTDK